MVPQALVLLRMNSIALRLPDCVFVISPFTLSDDILIGYP